MKGDVLHSIRKCKNGVETEQFTKNLTTYIQMYRDQRDKNFEGLLLKQAVERKLYTSVKLMLDNQFDLNIKSTLEIITPMQCAAKNGDNKMIELLTQYDVNINSILNPRFNIYHTALTYSIESLKYSTVKLLLKKGANPNLAIGYNNRPLNTAITNKYNTDKHKKIRIVKLLIKYGAKIELCEDLVLCTLQYLPKLIPYLIRYDLNINKNQQLKILIDNSQYYNIVKQLKILLFFGVNPNIKDKFGIKPINYLIRNRYSVYKFEKIKSLLESWSPVYTLYALSLRMILIHDVDTTGVPKSVLQIIKD